MAETPKRKGRRARFKRPVDAADQLSQIEQTQRAVREGKLHRIVDNVDKSKQRFRNGLRRVRDLDDAIEDFD